MFPFHFSLLRWNQAPLLNRMHLSAFSRGEVRTGHIAQGTRASFQNLLGALGCSFMLSVALSGLCSRSGLTPLLPFTHCSCPLSWPFTLPSCPPSPFYESFIHLLWLLRVFVAFCSCCKRGCFSLWWLLSLQSTGSRQAGSGVAPQHVGSSWTRD